MSRRGVRCGRTEETESRAENLGISEQVVKNYLYKIYVKLKVENRVELALGYETQLHEGRLRRRSHSEPISTFFNLSEDENGRLQ